MLFNIVTAPIGGPEGLLAKKLGTVFGPKIAGAGAKLFASGAEGAEKFGVKAAAEGAEGAAKASARGWKRGDDIWAPTAAGNEPAWSTVRGRYWKNAAEDPRVIAQWDDVNVARMKRGRAPQRFNPDKGGMESMELGHEPVPARDGGQRLVPRWPQDHSVVDPYRRPGY